MKNNYSILLKKITGMAVFSALAIVVAFVFRIPVLFLSFDAKDAIITIAAFIYGPFTAPIMSLLVAFIEMITFSDTGPYGFIMNFASSATFSLVSSLIYKYRRTFNGSLIGLYSAVVAVVAVMLGLNTLITPAYLGVPTAEVVKLLPGILLPFNLAKALINSAIVMLLYKPIIMSMRRAKLIDRNANDVGFNRKSIYSIVIASVTLVVAIVIFVILKNS